MIWQKTAKKIAIEEAGGVKECLRPAIFYWLCEFFSLHCEPSVLSCTPWLTHARHVRLSRTHVTTCEKATWQPWQRTSSPGRILFRRMSMILATQNDKKRRRVTDSSRTGSDMDETVLWWRRWQLMTKTNWKTYSNGSPKVLYYAFWAIREISCIRRENKVFLKLHRGSWAWYFTDTQRPRILMLPQLVFTTFISFNHKGKPKALLSVRYRAGNTRHGEVSNAHSTQSHYVLRHVVTSRTHVT